MMFSVFRAHRAFRCALLEPKCKATVAVVGRQPGSFKWFSSSPGDGPEPHYVAVAKGCTMFHCPEQIVLSKGGVLDKFNIAYEMWGELNEKKDNAVLLCCGLSASSHAKSHPQNPRPGWWEEFIGPGKAVDTGKFCVICTNNLGGCYGSTGPGSLNPRTKRRYGLDFPAITVQDMVAVQFKLLDHLGVGRLHAVIGSSLGGMQSLAAAALYSERVANVVSISAAAESHPLAIAMRFVQRQALMADPNFKEGNFYDSRFPSMGMKLGRSIGTITYRSGPEWEERFGRESTSNQGVLVRDFLQPHFLIEKYLDYQGEKWCSQYDPNSMLVISKAMDFFTLAVEGKNGDTSLANGMEAIKMPALILGSQSDVLFPIWQQKQIADVLRQVGNKSVLYYELDSLYGHDTFLIDVKSVGAVVKGHLEHRI